MTTSTAMAGAQAGPEVKARVAIAITHSFVLRNYVESGLADALERALDARVEFVSTMPVDRLASPSGRSFPHHPVQPLDDGRMRGVPRWLQLVSAVRRRLYALEVPHSGVVHARMRARLLGRNPLQRAVVAGAVRLLRLVAPRHSRLRTLARAVIERQAARGVVPSPLFDQGGWSLLIVGSPGHLPLDGLLCWQARKAGIPTLCIMSSWDNMVTKGPLMARVDRIAVWNGEMQEQARMLHGYPRQRTPAVGALQFVMYGKPRDFSEESSALQRMGLQPRGYILFIGSQRAPEYEVEDIRALSQALRASPRFRSLQLVVRNHPQADPLLFEEVVREGIVLDKPPQWKLAGPDVRSFDAAAIRHMRTLLANAAAVVASWGTTGLLEATIFDRPVIQLSWMDAVSHSRADQAATMRELRQYAHLQSFYQARSHLFCTSPDEFADCLARLIDEDDRFRSRRKLAVANLVVQPLDDVVERIAADCAVFLGLADARPAARA
jgi:hypothetical protein